MFKKGRFIQNGGLHSLQKFSVAKKNKFFYKFESIEKLNKG